MTAAVTITVQQLEDVLLVPNRAVRLIEGKWYVFIQSGGQVDSLTLADTSEAADRTPSGIVRNPIVAGIVVSLSNPYWTIWWATIGLGYIALSRRLGFMGLASFFSGHILSDLIWYSIVALALTLGRSLITDRIYRGLVGLCGVFLVAFGLYFGYSGWKMFP
jgi:threonine/homoserine/homoserine lactone efflux protein